MKPISVIQLFKKICLVSKSPIELKADESFNDLVQYMSDNWVKGDFEKIRQEERANLLLNMAKNGISSRRLFGSTTNAIMLGKIDTVESITEVLYVMGLSKYDTTDLSEMDKQFMDKVTEVFVKEPVEVKPAVACKMLWSLYAINHKSPALLKVLSTSISDNHTIIPE